jgi:hypothetical protein
MHRIRWGRIVLAAFFAEATIMVLFFVLLAVATAAGEPEIAEPGSTLDNIDAMVASFATMYLFTLWAGKRIESAFVLHGALIGGTGMLLFSMMWLAGTESLAQPAPYVVAHLLKVLGGMTGGVVVQRRKHLVAAGE